MTIELIQSSIRDIPDFPKPGIIFKDITTLLNNPAAFKATIDLLCEAVKNKEFDFIASIESRGFIFGAALAARLNKAFVPIRKPRKLPGKTLSESYKLEYGTDTLEIHNDAFSSFARKKVILIDDLLATGGSANAALNLIKKAGGDPRAMVFVIELDFLNGRAQLPQGVEVLSLIHY